MAKLFINLKRFDIPEKWGGICPSEDPEAYIASVMRESVGYGLGKNDDLELVYLLPEGLILSARAALNEFSPTETKMLGIGCQGVFRENVKPGGNFGAFTTNLPAAAARNLGCSWSIIGHSEERRDKLGIIKDFAPEVTKDRILMNMAHDAIDNLINQEVLAALESEINVLFCIGETAEQRGDGDFSAQQVRIETALYIQILNGLKGVKEYINGRQFVIAYEPIWAIGPGKTPPGKEYIAFVSELIKDIVEKELGFTPEVVYGGGLKEENAGMLPEIETIDGGLVALTRFSGKIGFSVAELKRIADTYLNADISA